MKLSRLLVFSVLINFTSLFYAQETLYQEAFYIQDQDTLKYRIMYPKDFNEDIQYPVILFLHGAGERGNDNQKQLVHGSKLFASDKTRSEYPAIVIFPQCIRESYWSNATVDRSSYPISLKFPANAEPTKPMKMVIDLMDEFTSKPFVKKEQVYVGGLSMGGMGTFEILSRRPDMFAASFAICGGGNTELAEKYALKVPMWIFHGANDDVVKPQMSIDMVSAILKYGGKPNFTLYADANHNSWDPAFAEPNLLPWLFSKSK